MISLVQEYFSESAKKFPHKTAIACQDQTISFEQAEQLSNSFAKALKASGVKRGQLVPFFMTKSEWSILSILSILKADCAYVPIDINSPASRLKSILGAANATHLVATSESQKVLEELLTPNELPEIINIENHEIGDTSPIDYQNISVDIAYVLFTSGSTGIPKGVMIPHKAIIDYIDWCVETYQITDKDIVSNHAPLYFDNSTFDIYTAFKAGSSLHLVHEALNAVIPKLVSWLKERKVSVFFCVPSVLTMLLKSRRLKPDSMQHMKHIICAGEVLPPDVVASWMELYPQVQFTNMYGPTEITVDCSYHVLTDIPKPGCQAIPIGKARKNMELFVRLDSGKLTQEKGAKGELLVRGTSVAYGYLGDSEKTSAAFIQNPNHSLFHDPLYCTGDLVEIDNDGNYLFKGREDSQIKFLGYRIELGEIESALCSLESVVEGVVVFNHDPDESLRQIGALVELAKGVTAKDLTQQLQKKLPGYMIPTKIEVASEEFKRTPNGKYDRKAITKQLFA